MATRYWVGGSGTWNSTATANWSASSGGASGASAPTALDNVIFDNNSNVGTGAFTVTIGTGALCLDMTFGSGASALDGAMTMAGTGTLTISTPPTLPASNLSVTGTFTLTMTGVGTLTTNGVSLACAVVYNGSVNTNTLTLGSALTTTSSFTLTQGTVALGSNTLTCNTFASSNTNTRSITRSTGKIVVSGNNATVFNMGTVTNYSGGGIPVEFSYIGSVGTRTINPGTLSEANVLDFFIAVGASDTVTITSGSTVGDLSFVEISGFGGTWTNNTITIYGKFFVSSGMSSSGTNIVTLAATSGTQAVFVSGAGTVLDFPVTFTGAGTRSLSSNVTLASTKTLTHSAGSLLLNTRTLSCGSFVGSSTTTRSITFGTGAKIVVTGSGGTIFNMTNTTGFTYSGTSRIEFSYSGSTGTRTITPGTGPTEATSLNFYITAGSDTVTITTGGVVDILDFTGFSGIWTNNTLTVYSDLTISSTMTVSAGSSAVTFAATSGTQTITAAGKTLDFPITFSGVGGTRRFAAATTIGTTRTLSLTGGTFDLNGFNISCGILSVTGTSTRSIAFGTNTISVTAESGTVVNTTNLTGFSYTGTPNIDISGSRLLAGTTTVQGATTGATESNVLSFKVSASSTNHTIEFGGSFLNVEFTSSYNRVIRLSAATTLYGNFIIANTGATFTESATVLTFAATSGTKTIDVNDVDIGVPHTFNGAGGTWQLLKNYRMVGSVDRTLTLTAGTIDLNSLTFTVFGAFSLTGTTARSITGPGTIDITSTTGTVLSGATSTNLTSSGDPLIKLSGNASGASTRTISLGSTAGASETTALNISVTAGTDTIAITAGSAVKDLSFTGFSGTHTNTTRTIYGNLTLSGTMSLTAGTSAWTFAGSSGSKTITTNGENLDFPLTFNGAGSTWVLQDDLASGTGTARTFTLTAGTFDLNNKTATIYGALTLSGTGVRALNGPGTLKTSLNGVTVVNLATSTNFTVGGTGTPLVECSYSGATGTRTLAISTSLAEANTFNLKVSAGTDTVTFNGMRCKNLDFTGFAGTYTAASATIYGDVTISSGMSITGAAVTWSISGTNVTQYVTTNGKALDFDVWFFSQTGTRILNDALIVSPTRTFFPGAGTLTLNGFDITCGKLSLSGTNTRVMNFGTNKIYVTDTSGTVFNIDNNTNLTITGTPNIEITGAATVSRTISGGSAGATQDNALNIKVTAGSDTITLQGVGFGNLEFTSGFTGTITLGSVSPSVGVTCYGNFTLGGTITTTASTLTLTFAATSGTKTITTSGNTLDFNVTMNGVGGTWQLQDAFTLAASRVWTLTAGTFDANIYNVTVPTFSSSGSGVRSISFGSGTWTISDSGTAWNCTTSTNLTTTPGTAIITMTSASSKTFAGGSKEYPTLNQGGAGQLTISGSNTFANITNTVQPATILFTSGTTQTFTAFSLSGTSGNLITIGSTTTAQHTLSMASGTVSVSFCTISYSNATGGASWQAYTTNGNVDGGNNTGWLFAAIGYNGYVGFFSFFN